MSQEDRDGWDDAPWWLTPGSARWIGIICGAGLLWLTWRQGELVFLTAGVPFGIVALVAGVMAPRLAGMQDRHRALLGGAMVLLVMIPDVAAVNFFEWHDRLYTTPGLLTLGFVSVLHFGIKELRDGGRDSREREPAS